MAQESSTVRNWRLRKKVVTRGDTIVDDGTSSDVVIAVMGPTGVGKSTFINTYFGKDSVAEVGHQLKSCTANLKHIIANHPTDPTRRLVMVDTPGFDDTYVDDAEILRRISVWLAVSYTKDMKLAGVIYLHEISQPRMLGTTRKNLEMFSMLCGKDALKSVVLGTTKWSQVDKTFGKSRLDQLKATFWSDMINEGSHVFEFHGNKPSADAMVNYLLEEHTNYEVLQLQKELVDLQRLIPDTDAGKELRYTLEQVLKCQKYRAATEEQLRKTQDALKALQVPMTQRLMQLLPSSFSLSAFTRTSRHEITSLDTTNNRTTTRVTQTQTTATIERVNYNNTSPGSCSAPVNSGSSTANSAAVFQGNLDSVSTPLDREVTAAKSVQQHTAVPVLERTCSVETQADDALQSESHRFTSTSVTETQTTSVTGSHIFGNSRDFGISDAVMNDGDHSTVNYTHTENHTYNDSHVHIHLNQPLDIETWQQILQSAEKMNLNVDSSNRDEVHIRSPRANVTRSSKKPRCPNREG